ncbi:MAG: competence/damage-inducible protein A [Acidobacteriota bacterium]|nr:competence/damage-inducible protein A [Blastocatellia bacterium]MDW8240175.1 competence/damage-inducible protein A [Acidobacteriota bacterium]
MEKKPFVAAILAVGSELLTPFRTDTNSLYLTEQLNSLGIDVKLKMVVGDELERIVECVRVATQSADLIIATGGLGPTEDDLTREAFAAVLGRKLIRSEELLQGLRARFARYGFRMTPNNERQADVIEGAEILPNARGSAPGQFIEDGNTVMVLLPGPPGEMMTMFEREALPRLRQRYRGFFMARRQLRVGGLTESAMDNMIAPIYRAYSNPTTTVLSSLTGLEVHLTATGSTMEEAQSLINELSAKLEEKLGANVVSTDGASLEQVIKQLCVARGYTVALAESCTGGLIAKRLTDVPGSSAYFIGGVVAYANQVKVEWLDVPATLIETHGAVSAQVAEAMAQGVQHKMGATIGLAVTGIAGPEGGTAEKPVGLVYIGLALKDRVEHKELRIPGDRERVRELTTTFALDWLRRTLIG